MSIKSRLEKLVIKMKNASNYSQIISKHAIEIRKGWGPDECILVHTIMALYSTSHPEHKAAMKSKNYLEWMHKQPFNAIPRAYVAINDLIASGLTKFMPMEFFSDNRDISGMIPSYPYLCNPEQILNYSTSKDTQFWLD